MNPEPKHHFTLVFHNLYKNKNSAEFSDALETAIKDGKNPFESIDRDGRIFEKFPDCFDNYIRYYENIYLKKLSEGKPPTNEETALALAKIIQAQKDLPDMLREIGREEPRIAKILKLLDIDKFNHRGAVLGPWLPSPDQ